MEKRATASTHDRPDIQSFYSLATADLVAAHCQGTACFVARHLNADRWHKADALSPRIYCLGKCYAAPATGEDRARPRIEVRSSSAVVLERIVVGGAHSVDKYQRHEGLGGLRIALSRSPQEVVAEIEASELRGRGGAGFPTGTKWLTAAMQSSAEK